MLPCNIYSASCICRVSKWVCCVGEVKDGSTGQPVDKAILHSSLGWASKSSSVRSVRNLSWYFQQLLLYHTLRKKHIVVPTNGARFLVNNFPNKKNAAQLLNDCTVQLVCLEFFNIQYQRAHALSRNSSNFGWVKTGAVFRMVRAWSRFYFKPSMPKRRVLRWGGILSEIQQITKPIEPRSYF